MNAEHSSDLRSQTLNRLSQLPAFDLTALKLLTISADDQSALEDFEAAFRSDPALATDLLILANSMEFGFRCEITNIAHALLLLGLDRARAVASRIALRSCLSGQNADFGIGWRHSLASAALAEHLAKASSLSLPMLYTAALLHDIGRLGMLLTLHEKYSSLMSCEVADIGEVLAVEEKMFGMNHCEAGGALSRAWGFPESLRCYIHMHHGAVSMDKNPTIHTVQTACRLAEALGYPECAWAPPASQASLDSSSTLGEKKVPQAIDSIRVNVFQREFLVSQIA